jgi:rhodanese-related sulfurtransferase
MDRNSVISIETLQGTIGRADAAWIIDVRKPAAFGAAERMIAAAIRRPPDAVDSWAGHLPADADIVVYCAHGQEVSQGVAAALRQRGLAAHYLEGGFAAWTAADGLTMRKPAAVLAEAGAGLPDTRPSDIGGPSRWITRARPKIDRIACPWLLRRFIDRQAEIRFVAPARVVAEAASGDAVPFDIPDVAFSHVGPECSFDAFLKHFGLAAPALDRLAVIVRGADTGRLDLAPEAAGLLAVSLGLSALCPDDDEMLARGFPVYDALYAWARDAAGESHGWPPAAWAEVM